jgi:hypothetical protein
MADFLETRWRGVRHVFWGSQLRQAQVTAALHLELFNLDRQLLANGNTPPAEISLPLGGRAGPPAHASRAERAMRAFEAFERGSP